MDENDVVEVAELYLIIEALQKELEAAKADIHRTCQTCKHMVDVPKYCRECYVFNQHGSPLTKWEWRGVVND